jgi:predicted nuclease of predicted toxin-antitoxin system
MAALVIRFFLDENVPDSVARYIRGKGHEVYLAREIIPAGSPDPLVATISEENDWVLVSADHDFDRIAPRIPKGHKARFRKLSRISLQCSEHQAAQRLEEFFDYVILEHERTRSLSDQRMFITIQSSGFKIVR